jgi:transposase
MPKSHAPYPPEFRAEAIRLLRTSGKPTAQIARELDVTTETLRIWRKQADVDDGLRHDGLTTEETEEVRQLRREVKRLREEREILLKAAAFFAKETGQTPR